MAPVTAMQTGNDMHTHTVTIMASEINMGMPTMFTVSSAGNPAHTHTITLMPADFTTLRMGMSVTKTSSTVNNHSHMYMIDCA
jgi:hypothetical protein